MADLTDAQITDLRPNPNIDRATELVYRRDLNALLDEVIRHRASQLSAEDITDLRALRSDLIDAWDSESRASRRSGTPPGVEVIDRLLAAHGAKP